MRLKSLSAPSLFLFLFFIPLSAAFLLTPSAAGAEAPPAAEQNSETPSLTSEGDVLFRESKTALMPATAVKGKVTWSIIHEKTDSGTDTCLRAELTVPERDMILRITIRPNHDKTIPAVYLAEMMFIMPEHSEDGAIDKISPLLLRQTQDSEPQDLDKAYIYKIQDNFFVMSMNSPARGNAANPGLKRNIALMERSPWLGLLTAYKSGRIAEFKFSKGDKGDALVRQFFEAQTAASQGLPAAAAGKRKSAHAHRHHRRQTANQIWPQ